MTVRRAATLVGLGVAFVLAGMRDARAYSFAEEVPEDPCVRSVSLDPGDTSVAAQKARRACRLERFEQRLAQERRQEVAAGETARDAWVQKWMVGTQPSRVLHPMAVEAFAGSGIVNYGAAFSWDVLSHLELAARIGQRQMSCADQFSGTSADCTRTTWGAGVRWIMGDRDFSPFVGTAFSSTNAALKILHYDQMANTSNFLDGKGRAHSVSLSGGLQLAISYVRLSLEYLYEYVFYTGANLNDPQLSPSEELRAVWEDSLRQDRHGVRFQVGVAF
jgi:hypothetical protein